MYVCFGVVGKKEGNSLKKETFIYVSEASLRLHDTHHRIPSTSVYKTPSPPQLAANLLVSLRAIFGCHTTLPKSSFGRALRDIQKTATRETTHLPVNIKYIRF